MVLPKIDGVTALLRDLLQHSLGTRGRTEVVQPRDDAYHGRHRNQGGFLAQAALRTCAEVNVGVNRAVEADLVRRGEGDRVTVGSAL